MFFSVFCSVTESEVLIFGSQVRGLRNTPAGIELDFWCACGAAGVFLAGRAAEHEMVRHPFEAPQALAG